MGLVAIPEVKRVTVHGKKRAYVLAGDGPPLLLVHGMGSDHTTWLPVLSRLTRRFTVIAPDLLGHGQSDKPRADYSLGGYANGMRDLLTILGIDRVTVVGHSFGGGVAMQFAYQYPERAERVVLVASGGLGHHVNPLLRAATLPGAGLVLAAAAVPPVHLTVRTSLALIARTGLPMTADAREMATVFTGMLDGGARLAFLKVLRAAVDWRGQYVTMTDRGYLAANMPVCVIWGDRDTVVPVRHADRARETIPSCRVQIIQGAGHFPHRDRPEQFVQVLSDFVDSTAPSRHDRRRWRALLRTGGVAPTPALDAVLHASGTSA